MKSNKIATGVFITAVLLIAKFSDLSAFKCCLILLIGLWAFHEQSEFIKGGGFHG